MKWMKKATALLVAALMLVTLSVTALAAVNDTGFSDVDAAADYAQAVVWCQDKGLMNGVSATEFAPNGTLTRSMVATILYRAEGEPAVTGAPAFTDTQAGTWYSSAVVWANQDGIIRGYGNGLFGTNDPVSVEQLEVISGRYSGNGPEWVGDPARAVAATRAQAAVSFYATLTAMDTTEPATPDEQTPTQDGKVLVAYFSATNTTEGVAEKLAAALSDKADLYEIVPETPYTSADLNYNTDCRANREQNDASARPAISGSVEGMENYGVVFLGYPIWWGQAPKIIYTFLESYDFSGKTIVPFCTSGGSGYNDSGIKALVGSDTTWMTGQRFSGSVSQASVQTWVDGLGLELSAPPAVTVNDGFVEISGGAFTMGSPAGEPERSSDETQHEVTVGSFYLSPTEVTQKEYAAVMGRNPSGSKGDDLPVTDVTWYDAIAYCNARSEAEGLTPAYTVDGTAVTWNKAANGYRLPTEAEWEYAARANTTTPFSFGDYVHNSDANCYNAYGYNNDASGNWVNGSDSYLRRTVEVTRYTANAYGLYNMHGNVAEWVWDWYGGYDTQADTDPTGPVGGNAKVVRGGGWNDHPKHIRSAYRGAHPADVSLYSIGIRLARGASTGEVTSTPSVGEAQAPGKVLIAYFSQTGNTVGLANLIHDMSGADIVRIERATPYSSSSNGPILYGEALNELRAEATPEIMAYPDLDQYDTILLGYCNWWSSIPASVRTLLSENDLSGKTIIPFCSMGGGHFGQTISAIAKLAPGSTIKEGLEVTYSAYDRDEIRAWLAENGIPTK